MTKHRDVLRQLRRQLKRQNKAIAARGGATTNIPVKKSNKNRQPVNILDKNKDFPRLTDESQAADLETEFVPYIAKAKAFYEATAMTAAYLQAMLNNRTTASSLSSGDARNHISAGDKQPESFYLRVFESFKKDTASPGGKYLKIKGNDIQLDLHSIRFNVTFRSNGGDDDAGDNFADNMTTLFGQDFKMPVAWKKGDRGQTVADIDEDQVLSTQLKPFTYFQKLKFEKAPAQYSYQPDSLELPVKYKFLDKTLGIEVKLERIHVSASSFSSSDTGPIGSRTCTASFQVKGVVTLPLEYALWSTYATSLTNFIPKVFRDHFNKIGLLAIGSEEPGSNYYRTMTISALKEINNQRVEELGLQVKPRVNADNFCILSTGAVFYLPPNDQSAQYIDILRKSYNQESGEVLDSAKIQGANDLVLSVDWINDVFIYTGREGQQQFVLLRGAIPLDDLTITRYLFTPFAKTKKAAEGKDDDEDDRKDFFAMLRKIGDSTCQKFNLYEGLISDARSYLGNTPLSYNGLFNFMANYLDEAFIDLVRRASKVIKNGVDDETMAINEAKTVMLFVQLNQLVTTKLMQLDDFALRSRCEFMFWFYVFGVYANRSNELAELWVTSRRNNEPIPLAQQMMVQDVKISNLPGVKNVLPHQIEICMQADRAPTYLELGAGAGAGKTLMLIIDILKLKEQGKINRALIICPKKLVKEYVSETNRYSKGMLNAVPIDADVISKLVDIMGWDRKKYVEYMRSLPINTIYVMAINFIALKSDPFKPGAPVTKPMMQISEELSIRFYQNMQLIRQLDFDYIGVDEAHYVSNEKSDRTRAVLSLTPMAKYRRIASGTLVYDNPANIVGEMSVLNPAIYANNKNFLKNYAAEARNGKIKKLKEGATQLLTATARPYVVQINKSRKDWAQLMPTLEENLVLVQLKPEQQEYYNHIISKAVNRIKTAAPKLVKLMDNGDEESEGKIAAALENELHVVEQFINAPEMYTEGNITLLDGDYFKPKDRSELISSKVKQVDRLIREHFARGDENKIIVFGYNKVVSKHVWKYTKFQDIGIHYSVDGSVPRRGDDSTKISGDVALLKFRNDPKIKILFADETSLREGLNLQIASELIRLQTVFSPGAMEQANARILRPDVYNVYNRDKVLINWIITEFTVEMGKTARFAQKMMLNARTSQRDDPRWQQFLNSTTFVETDPISLNMEFLTQFQTQQSVRIEFGNYLAVYGWEKYQAEETKARLLKAASVKLNKPENQINIRLDTMIPCDGSAKLPGSKSAWTPLINGTEPLDPRGLNLKALAVMQKAEDGQEDKPKKKKENEDEDEDEGDQVDQLTFERGDIICTEFGWGTIITPLANQVRVSIPGFNGGKYFSLSKQVVYKPTPPDLEGTDKYNQWLRNLNQLQKDIKKAGAKGITFIQGGAMNDTTMVPNVNIERPPPKQTPIKAPPKPHPAAKPENTTSRPTPADETDNNNNNNTGRTKPPKNIPNQPTTKPKSNIASIEIDAFAVDGLPLLACYGNDKDLEHFEELVHEFYVVPAFLNAQVGTRQGAVNFYNWVKLNFPNTSQESLNELNLISNKLTGKTTTTDKLSVRGSASGLTSKLRQFFKIQHTPNPDQKRLKFYCTLFDDELYVCVPIAIQRKQVQQLRMKKVKGMGNWVEVNELRAHYPNSVPDAIRMVKQWEEKYNIRTAQSLLNSLRDPTFRKLVGYVPKQPRK